MAAAPLRSEATASVMAVPGVQSAVYQAQPLVVVAVLVALSAAEPRPSTRLVEPLTLRTPARSR